VSGRNWHLVCYDVRDDKRLRKTAKLLEGYGDRVQYSVFRCRLTRRELQRLRWELLRVLEQEDAWLIVPLCDACTSKVDQHGDLPDWPVDPPKYMVV
jgi:CRISPR-associated protein Cas2